jgi:arylsulfatase
LNRPHSITADVDIPESGAEGVLLSQGGAPGGYSFYVTTDGRLRYVHNYVGRALYSVTSPDPVPAGKHTVRFEFEPTGEPDMAAGRGAPGRLQLYIDDDLVGNTDAPITIPFVINPGALSCGRNPGSPPNTSARSRSPADWKKSLWTSAVTSSRTPTRNSASGSPGNNHDRSGAAARR